MLLQIIKISAVIILIPTAFFMFLFFFFFCFWSLERLIEEIKERLKDNRK